MLATAPRMTEVKVLHAGKPYCSRLTTSAASNGAEVGEEMQHAKSIVCCNVKRKKEGRRRSSAKPSKDSKRVPNSPRMTKIRFNEHLTKTQY